MASAYKIDSRIVDQMTGHGVAGAVVEAWDKDPYYDDLVGTTTTDDDGYFHLAEQRSFCKSLSG